MQGRSTLMSGSTLFERFLMKVTSNYRKFTRRRILLIYLPRLFGEWSLHIVKNYSISFHLCELSGARLDELRVAWSHLAWVCRQQQWCTNWSWYGAMLCSVQIWEIFTEMKNCGEREGKILLIEFFKLCWSLAKVDTINGVKYESVSVVSMIDCKGGTHSSRLGIWPSRLMIQT